MLEPANVDNIKPTFEVGDLVTLLKVDELPDDYRYIPCSDRNKYGGSIFVIRDISKNEVIGHTNEDGYEYRIELLKTDVKVKDNTTSIGSSIDVIWWLPSGLKLFSKGFSAIADLATQSTSYIPNPYTGVDLASDRADIAAYCQNDIETFLDSMRLPVDMFSKRNDSDKLELHLKVRKKPIINFNN